MYYSWAYIGIVFEVIWYNWLVTLNGHQLPIAAVLVTTTWQIAAALVLDTRVTARNLTTLLTIQLFSFNLINAGLSFSSADRTGCLHFVTVPNSNVCCEVAAFEFWLPGALGSRAGIDRAWSAEFGSLRQGPGVDTRSTTLVLR